MASAYAVHEIVRLHHAERPTIPLADRRPEVIYRLPTVSPAGHLIATSRNYDTLDIWRSSDGTLVQSWPAQLSIGTVLAFSPDTARIAVGHRVRDPSIQMWRVADGAVLQELSLPAGTIAAAFVPDGRLLITATRDNRVYLWQTP